MFLPKASTQVLTYVPLLPHTPSNRPCYEAPYLINPDWIFGPNSAELPTLCSLVSCAGVEAPAIELVLKATGALTRVYLQYPGGCKQWAAAQHPSCLLGAVLLDDGHDGLRQEDVSHFPAMNGEVLIASHPMTATAQHVEDCGWM